MSLEVTILGCGSSGGVPRIGDHWGACDRKNPKNRRRRCSILVRRASSQGVTSLLVDSSPDLRQQLLDTDTGWLDGVVYTHIHADHTHGIDELRAVAINGKRCVRIWADRSTMDSLRRRFAYCFETPPASDYPPILDPHVITPPSTARVDGLGGAIEAQSFPLEHGAMEALGFRFGALAYTPDVSNIPDESIDSLRGLDVWIVDALRPAPHPSHFNVALALDWIDRLKPRHAILTNMHLDLDYETLKRDLPRGVEPAFDGLVVTSS